MKDKKEKKKKNQKHSIREKKPISLSSLASHHVLFYLLSCKVKKFAEARLIYTGSKNPIYR